MISEHPSTDALPPHWMALADRPTLDVGTLREMIGAEPDLLGRLLPHRQEDATKPYGRRVLLDGANLEVMIAAWTRGVFCAPHDHGGSQGGVRVLQGRVRHRIYSVANGELQMVREEVTEKGDLVVCGRNLIHAMGDDGADAPLVTLHMYTGPVQHMIVYDEARHRTLKVDGGCGAWVPPDGSVSILESSSGILPTL